MLAEDNVHIGFGRKQRTMKLWLKQKMRLNARMSVRNVSAELNGLKF